MHSLRSDRYSSTGLIFCTLLLTVAAALLTQGATTWGYILLAVSIVGLLVVAVRSGTSRRPAADDGQN